MYYDGYGILKDYNEALKWNTLASKLGNIIAKCMIGKIYAKQGKYSKAKTIVQEGYNEGAGYCATVWSKYKLGER